MKRRIKLAVIALLAFPAGCSLSETPPAAGALAARVNGTAISLSQGNSSKEKLERVIDRELLVQKAMQAGLDRSPEVVQKIEEARRQVLAQAWLDLAATRGGRTAAAEVTRFYAENPALFAQRRVYRFQELTVAMPTDKRDPNLDLIKAELPGARDLDDIAGWLKWRNLKVSPVASVTMAAEQLPLSHLPQLARMKEGEIAVLPSPLGASVIQLVHAQEAPLSAEQAAPVIEQFLAGRKRLEVAAAEVRRLRETASIEYVGEFKR
jgi:EpsD family peptidyl-prolyl cis-trans isomerase